MVLLVGVWLFIIVGSNCLYIGCPLACTLAATGLVASTKLKPFILVSAAASLVIIHTWFNHLLLCKMVTLPANLMLSIYFGVMGKSLSSIAILYRTLLAMALCVKYGKGLLMVNGVPVLFLNCTMYLLNCAATFWLKLTLIKNKIAQVLVIIILF